MRRQVNKRAVRIGFGKKDGSGKGMKAGGRGRNKTISCRKKK